MGEEMGFEGILGESEIESLFGEPEDTAAEEKADDATRDDGGEEEKKNSNTFVHFAACGFAADSDRS